MSIVLGLHFGHDGNAAIIRNGRVASYLLRERMTRRKHDYGFDRRSLNLVLAEAGITLAEIDYVAVTSTQGCDVPQFEMGDFSLRYAECDVNGLPCPLRDQVATFGPVEPQCAPSMLARVLAEPRDPTTHPIFLNYFEPYRGKNTDQLRTFPWFEGFLNHPAWASFQKLEDIACADLGALVGDKRTSHGFHLPLTVTIDGRAIPGIRVDHHLAHAASSYFRSPFEQALIITNDGYGGKRKAFSNGGIYYGRGGCLYPLQPHLMIMGHLYHSVGMEIGFDPAGAPGKLMGLAPYGRPLFYDPRRIGNLVDHQQRALDQSPEAWIADVRLRARALSMAPDAPAEEWIPFNRYQLALAASTQLLFEKQWLALIRASLSMARHSGLCAEHLCISGGAALNCPSNTHILQKSGVRKLFMEPSVDDGGLSIGAGLWLAHHLLGDCRPNPVGMSISEAYAGACLQPLQRSLPEENQDGLLPSRPSDPAVAAAADIADGKVVGWLEGRSEQGPRALGHRSILALPTVPGMLERVNSIKRRELWRPLAPAVLVEHLHEVFEDLPVASPFMLLTARVRRPDLYPAITHVDGSARVQTVTRENGGLWTILMALQQQCGVPVVLNTSLNGPGEPIIETDEEALRFLVNSGLDALYLDGVRYVTSSRSG